MTIYKTDTKLAQIGNRSDQITGTVNAPVYFSTAYRHAGIGKSTGYDYVRSKNPTRDIVEKAIADLECGDQGFACSSGMAAIFTILSLFKTGDEWIVSKDLYGGTYRLLERGFKKWGLHCHYVDTSNVENISATITSRTRAIFIETPTNPLMETANIEKIAKIAKQYNVLLIVDNTFFTPIIQKPLTLGADIVIHSATKYLAGHNDVLAGLIVAKGKELCETVSLYHNGGGAVLSPFDSWLLMRGMKTLSLRLQKHEENAQAIVHYLRQHPSVTDVYYPGRGGMISFRIASERWIDPLLRNLALITFAESLGGVESLITHPATQTHADMPEELRNELGICSRLLRLSVGIEDAEDLMNDLETALIAATKTEV